MASDKLKQGDKSTLSACFPQSNEELEPFHLQDGTDDLAGIFDNVRSQLLLIPTGDVHGMPQSNAQEMSFPVIKMISLIVNEFGQYHALGDSVAAANIHTTDLGNSQIERNTVTTGTDVGGGLQMLKAGEEAMIMIFVGLGHPVQSNKVSAAKVTEGDQFSKNIRVKQANEGNLGQSQASAPVKPSALAYNTGLEIPAVNRPPQSSSVPSGPSLKRTALICPPVLPNFGAKRPDQLNLPVFQLLQHCSKLVHYKHL
ncbi:hypothetical protein GH714_025663 [Hevea brasiliensis]|uniref:Uncharacterized protein n=1 Tax=Hevea brasiliensis TaxID=3981 RepID=A0A6A6LJB7_HEVBR|nr:hypothetical protein GH714_025663 [Hevea brasiliensis]